MDNPADYDTDILLWSETQGRIIRELAARVRGLPNDLDLENVAEEIESVGRSEQAAAESLLQLILVHLVKAAALPEGAPPQSHLRSEVIGFHANLLRRLSPSMPRRIDLLDVWTKSCAEAAASLEEYGNAVPTLPTSSPFLIEELTDKKFDPRQAMARLRIEIASATNRNCE